MIAGIPQGNHLGPVLYLLFTSDIPVMEDMAIVTFADGTATEATFSVGAFDVHQGSATFCYKRATKCWATVRAAS